MTRRGMFAAATLAAAVCLSGSAASAAVIEGGVVGLKLILLDKYPLGKAKAVFVAKDDPDIVKGPEGDPPGLTGTVRIIDLSDPSNQAVYDLPGWLVNKSTVAKYVDKGAAPGAAGVKVTVVKPGLVGKVVAKNLGDGDGASGDQSATDLDLQAFDGSETIRVVVSVDNANDGNTYVFCSDFHDLAVKNDNADQPFKVISKSSTAPASCAVGPTTTTTTTVPQPVCGNGVQEGSETCDDGNTNDNDACPSDCIADACTPAIGTDFKVDVNYTPPVGVGVAGIQLLLDYPEGRVNMPGSGGSQPAGVVTDTVATFSMNDFDHAVRATGASASNFYPAGTGGRLFRIHFESCQGQPAPTPGQFGCTVIFANDQDANDVNGVSCSVTLVP